LPRQSKETGFNRRQFGHLFFKRVILKM